MLKSNKGFTVIELIMSFVFASILSITLFAVVINYRGKQVDTTIETELLAFKSKIIMDVQKDIQKYGLYSMEYCKDGSGNIINRCVDIHYKNGTVKQFKVSSSPRHDTLYDDDGNAYDFTYQVPVIVYDGECHYVPDGNNVQIRSDYMLQSTSVYDGIESNTPIYKLRVYLIHNDLDADMDISIVANGTVNLATGTAPYKEYNIGQRVGVQLNNNTIRYFRVIQQSGGYNGKVFMLYDDDISLGNYEFSYSTGNNVYGSSTIKTAVDNLERQWYNVDNIRLISSEEIGYIVNVSPRYRGNDLGNQSLNCAPSLGYSWLVSSSYWTMSPKMFSDTPEHSSYLNKKVWYVDGPNKMLKDDYINSSHQLRPVIEVEKVYLTS